ncbi:MULTISPECIES: hypothetical protein [Nitrospirillum]|uniref:Uncharacterized protein n=1 Tax=Nitrospirillum amazonense TaxID=28077 RepID=A0A560FYZ9_9PROT|nr:hypothetical protein [Nitrospirillum amazonense]MEC4592458.1 hypothetical protein [Nitrospirillum amazonense]TWB26865.1 hypothetical protein FBZ88_10729 [Nitrospirillum amazonense]
MANTVNPTGTPAGTSSSAEPVLDAAERARRQRGKNLALFFSLLGFVALIYVVAIVRMGLHAQGQ